ncbi:MAG: hypothetical protein IIC52_01970 [Proteobacteria bacterium]|nr:hypothetical protein [Pseudomonadota bacterium]
MAIVAGIDEAGFGPTLGPLVVSGVAFRVPDDQVDRCLYGLLGNGQFGLERAGLVELCVLATWSDGSHRKLPEVVSDLADAHVKALKRLLEGGDIGFYNLGNGAGHSVKEVIEAARHITGREIATAIVPRRPGDPPALVADAGEAARVLGWRPERADVNVQMADAWRWHQSHFAT